MKTENQNFTLAVLATAILLASSSAAIAQDDDPVPGLITPDSSVSIGAAHTTGERDQFGIYDGIRDSNGVIPLLDADVNIRNDEDGSWTTLRLRNLGFDNRSGEAGYERQGNWGVGVNYSAIPYNSPYTVNSGITSLGETQSVPAAGSGYVPGTGTDFILGTERKRAGFDFYKYLSPGLDFKLSFKNEDKDGERHWGRGGAAEFAVEPIDSTNRILETTLNYAGSKLQLSGGYVGNWYNTRTNLVTTSNGSSRGTYNLSQPLDSQAHQVFMNGGYSFTSSTRGTFRVSYKHATADERLPTTDAGLGWAGAPTNLDGVLDTTVVFLGLTSRPMKNLSVLANVRYHKVDEKTPAWFVVNSTSTRGRSPAGTACGGAGGPCNTFAHSTPLDYETFSGKLEGTYRLPKGYSVVAGVDLKYQDRTVPFGSDFAGQAPADPADGIDGERYVPFRSELNEKTYRVQLRKSMSETVNGALAYSHSKRDGSTYSEATHSEPGEGIHPEAIDPVNIADRTRNKLRATLDWAPTDEANLTLNYETTRDDYSGHTLGLRDGSTDLVSVDASYAFNPDWLVSGWISRDWSETRQQNHRFASGSYSEAEMFDTLRGVGDSLGLSLEGKVNWRMKVGGAFEWTRTRNEYNQNLVTTGAGTLYQTDTVGPLPDIESTALKLSLFTEYTMSKYSDLRLDFIYERWKTDDWTWQFSDATPFTYGTTADGTVVTNDASQSSAFVGVRYIYKFK